jgi:hypothetical protein
MRPCLVPAAVKGLGGREAEAAGGLDDALAGLFRGFMNALGRPPAPAPRLITLCSRDAVVVVRRGR